LNQKKILGLLVLLVILINYINYFQKDRQKLFQRINLLQNKIEKEKRLNQTDVNLSSLSISSIKYFFDQNKTYSQSMGDMQEIINNAAKGVCKVSYVKWSKIPISKQWYEDLKFDISLVCKPIDIFKFVNNLKKEQKLIIFQDIHIVKAYKKELIQFDSKLIGFKVKNENK